jgi:hypothetical protein
MALMIHLFHSQLVAKNKIFLPEKPHTLGLHSCGPCGVLAPTCDGKRL